jgi:hypothetical protein
MSEGDRQRSIEAIEKYVDNAIHHNAIKNKLTFCVRTGVWGNKYSEKTDFYDIWFDKNLTPENRRIVQVKQFNLLILTKFLKIRQRNNMNEEAYQDQMDDDAQFEVEAWLSDGKTDIG